METTDFAFFYNFVAKDDPEHQEREKNLCADVNLDTLSRLLERHTRTYLHNQIAHLPRLIREMNNLDASASVHGMTDSWPLRKAIRRGMTMTVRSGSIDDTVHNVNRSDADVLQSSTLADIMLLNSYASWDLHRQGSVDLARYIDDHIALSLKGEGTSLYHAVVVGAQMRSFQAARGSGFISFMQANSFSHYLPHELGRVAKGLAAQVDKFRETTNSQSQFLVMVASPGGGATFLKDDVSIDMLLAMVPELLNWNCVSGDESTTISPPSGSWFVVLSWDLDFHDQAAAIVARAIGEKAKPAHVLPTLLHNMLSQDAFDAWGKSHILYQDRAGFSRWLMDCVESDWRRVEGWIRCDTPSGRLARSVMEASRGTAVSALIDVLLEACDWLKPESLPFGDDVAGEAWVSVSDEGLPGNIEACRIQLAKDCKIDGAFQPNADAKSFLERVNERLPQVEDGYVRLFQGRSVACVRGFLAGEEVHTKRGDFGRGVYFSKELECAIVFLLQPSVFPEPMALLILDVPKEQVEEIPTFAAAGDLWQCILGWGWHAHNGFGADDGTYIMRTLRKKLKEEHGDQTLSDWKKSCAVSGPVSLPRDFSGHQAPSHLEQLCFRFLEAEDDDGITMLQKALPQCGIRVIFT